MTTLPALAERQFPPLGPVEVPVLLRRQLKDGRIVVCLKGSGEVLKVEPGQLHNAEAECYLTGELSGYDVEPAHWYGHRYLGLVELAGRVYPVNARQLRSALAI